MYARTVPNAKSRPVYVVRFTCPVTGARDAYYYTGLEAARVSARQLRADGVKAISLQAVRQFDLDSQ